MLSKQSILEALGAGAEEQIYFEYTGLNVQAGKYYHNPFTHSNSKTFKIYVNQAGHLGFKDFSADRAKYNGDCFTAVMFALNTDFFSALKDIDQRFRLGLYEYKSYVPEIRKVEPYKPLDPKEHAVIDYAVQNMTDYDREYWQKRNIYPGIVEMYGVKSCSVAVVNGRIWTTSCKHMPVFVYEYGASCKIYSPKNKKKKWISNVTKETIDNVELLPDEIDKLVIASGKKDGLIFATHGYHQISFISETVIPECLPLILARCKEVYCWYDNDEPGKAATKKLTEIYPMIKPVYWDASQKDVTDYSEMNGFAKTKNLLHSHLGKPSFIWEQLEGSMKRFSVRSSKTNG